MEIAFDGFQVMKPGDEGKMRQNFVIPFRQCVDFTILIEKFLSSFSSDFILNPISHSLYSVKDSLKVEGELFFRH